MNSSPSSFVSLGLTPQWHGWSQRLPKVRPFGSVNSPGSRFTFRAIPRNPLQLVPRRWEWRSGVHGVRDRELLTVYVESLEAAYDWLIAQGRAKPIKAAGGKIPVYVFAVDDDQMDCGTPQMDEIIFRDAKGLITKCEPALILPSRSCEPLTEAERAQVMATAVHELSHYFNARFLPYRRIGARGLELPSGIATDDEFSLWKQSWLWLDEGLALLAEAEVLPKNRDWLAYAQEPVDRPERSLDCLEDSYLGMLFVRYLHRLMKKRKDSGFLSRVWKMSQTVWDPACTPPNPVRFAAVTALEEVLLQPPHSLRFCSANEPDVFASGFCFDSYFLNFKSLGYEPDIFDRFRERAVTQTWTMEDPAVWPKGSTEMYSLPGLACRYFRFLPNKKPAKLVVRVRAPHGNSLKADLAFAKGSIKKLSPGKRDIRQLRPEPDGTLECELEGFSSGTCHHAVLVVTNCAVANESLPHAPPGGYKTRTEFSVKAELV